MTEHHTVADLRHALGLIGIGRDGHASITTKMMQDIIAHIEALEGAVIGTTFESDGEVMNAYQDDVNLAEYHPIMLEVHRRALS